MSSWYGSRELFTLQTVIRLPARQVRMVDGDDPAAVQALEAPLVVNPESLKPAGLAMVAALTQLPEVRPLPVQHQPHATQVYFGVGFPNQRD